MMRKRSSPLKANTRAMRSKIWATSSFTIAA
jgi:hypothetical protein